MTQDTRETHTIQTWPSGDSFEYRGDPDGPAEQKQLRKGYSREAEWRDGTADEWRTIRIAIHAELYSRNLILCCDSSLVDELIRSEFDGFAVDDIRNTYADPSDWDADQCREYASDHGIDLPDVPVMDCPACDDGTRHEGEDSNCPQCSGTGEVSEPDYDTDDSRHGWLTEAREACQDYAQDNPAEVYEWWRVDSWLCSQLDAIGEVTIDNNYGYWWGRCCTGQGLIMDGTLQRIAAQYVRSEV